MKFKKGKVLLNGKEVFSFDRRSLGDEISIYSLENDDEIIYMLHNRNETNQYQEDDFKKILFLESEIIIESSQLRTNGWKSILKLLFKEKVLSSNGNINMEKLKKFRTKYDQNITNRTIRN